MPHPWQVEPIGPVVTGRGWTEDEQRAWLATWTDATGLGAGEHALVDAPDDVVDWLARVGSGVSWTGLSTDPDVARAQLHEARDHGEMVVHVQDGRDRPVAVEMDEVWSDYDAWVSHAEVRWAVMLAPTPEWAQTVYPELPALAAERALACDLMHAARTGTDFVAHVERMQARADRLNDLDATGIRIGDDGNDLVIGLLPGSRWVACEEAPDGRRYCANVPSEEIYTTPDPHAIDGHFTASRPFVAWGEVFEGVEGHLVGGRLVDVRATTETQTRTLRGIMLDERYGFHRVGEVGLVVGGRLAGVDRSYHNTIMDENGAIHLGFGASYDQGLTEEARAAGVRGHQAPAHVDVCIGRPSTRVWAHVDDGECLVSDGEHWRLPRP